jgi:hypothetical protein
MAIHLGDLMLTFAMLSVMERRISMHEWNASTLFSLTAASSTSSMIYLQSAMLWCAFSNMHTVLRKLWILVCSLSDTWGWSSRNNAIISWFRVVALLKIKSPTKSWRARKRTLSGDLSVRLGTRTTLHARRSLSTWAGRHCT